MTTKEKPKDDSTTEEAKEILETVEAPIVENKEKDLTERFQRLQAEFENFRKRTEKEKQDIRLNANADLISQLLPVLDNFELSLKHNEDKGVALIHEELINVLEKQGLKIIDTDGNFDPRCHEALIQVEGENHGKILEELQRGYSLNDKLLRASKVKISTVKNE